MKASPYITSQIAILLARANRPSTGYPLDGSLLQAAMKFLDKEMTNRMAECKQKKLQPYVGETEINYLYLCHLLDNKETPTIRYWRNQMGKDDVYGLHDVWQSGAGTDIGRNEIQRACEDCLAKCH